ncbi:hypothetical protein SAMN05216567_10153 [Variovorax sp. OK605]|uniref:hypothetical protein n=1 Tax=Variovorax sp. OK605 TaxID=1855317 RepID=UPI0008EFD6DF|nr:hypothetical protein [Variovorax sp. OK605]SFO51861.1 hypothetical protein SAMN05216567_10153 [Variovorax sp. OK605]
MSKMKTARQEWVDKFITAALKIEPRAAYDDIHEDACELYGTSGKEPPGEIAKRQYGSERTEYILGVNTPAWMKPGAEVPPGWRVEGGAWRNN